MPSTYARRHTLLAFGSVFASLCAGCLGSSPAADDTGETPTTRDPPTSQPPSAADGETLEPSLDSDREARKRALSAESAYLESRLQNASCVTEWSWYSPTSEDDAIVTSRTADRVLVQARHAYSYSTEDLEADTHSNARYAIGVDSVERLSGDEVTPCR